MRLDAASRDTFLYIYLKKIFYILKILNSNFFSNNENCTLIKIYFINLNDIFICGPKTVHDRSVTVMSLIV